MKSKTQGLGSIYLRGRTWWLQYSLKGRCIRVSANTADKAEAVRQLRSVIAAIDKGEAAGPRKLALAQLLDGLLADYAMKGLRSAGRVRHAIKHVLGFFGGGLLAASLDTVQITGYIVERQAEGAAAATINRELSALKRALTLACKARRLPMVPAIELLPENNARQGFIEHGPFTALHAALPDYLKDPIAFLYFSGWRREEVLGLEWRDVGADAIRLRIENSKSKQERTLPLCGELAAIIERARAHRRLDCVNVFHRDGKRIRDFRPAWRKALAQAGLDPSLLVHDLRRSMVRNTTRAGTPEKIVMALTGHKTRSVFDRYNIVSENDLQAALDRTAAYLEQQPAAPVVQVIVPLGKRA